MAKKSETYNFKFDDALKLSDRNIQKILCFYLFECPIQGKSVRGRKFSEYGISGSANFGKLKKKMLEVSVGDLKKNYYPCKKEELESKLKVVGEISPPLEYCVFLKHDETTVMQSLYSAIRNAFAHGGFQIKKFAKGNKIYYFENYDGYLKAKIVLHEETLLSWIKCIQEFNG